ncbi:Ig-like domain-containing protein [Sphingomonas humi]
MDIAPDGTMVGRTDTYGAYLWNGTSWDQLVTAASMPADVKGMGGVFEIRIAPSNTNIFYMALHGGIYKTTDRGQTWVKTSFPVGTFDANQANRMDGQKMAIDPNNPNIVFAGTQTDGLWVTRDGGTSWSKIAAVPQGTNGNDPSLTGISIKGSNVFVGTAGSGVYASTDGGYSWKSIGGPADVANAVIAPDGSYYAAGGNTYSALYKYANGTWTILPTAGGVIQSVSIDPFNANHIVAVGEGGTLQESWDGGKSFGGWNWAGSIESTKDVSWLETSGGYMSSSTIIFDPSVQGKLWQSAGVGVFETALPSGGFAWNTPIVWNSHSMGIEQLVGNEIIAPLGGNPIAASWDRPFFEVTNPDSYASSYGGGGFSMGWSVDYASSNSKFIVGISDYFGTENSGFSIDGGKTWQKFAGLPSWANDTVGGSIAASTDKNFIWVTSGNNAPAYTLDGGKTWSLISIPGVTDWYMVHQAYYLNRTSITADRVLPNTFYLQDPNSGVYRTTDGGVSWTKMFSGQPADWSYWNAKMEAVPGSAGELYFTSGPQGSDQFGVLSALSLMHSKDGGASWQAVAGVTAGTFGYGAPAVAGGPATVYIHGYVNGDYGIWYSADSAKTWTKIGEHPMGSLDGIRTISGDMDKFGVAYVGFGGSGYAYIDFSGSAPAPSTPPSVPTTPPPSQLGVIASALDDVGTAVSVGNNAVVNDPTPTLAGTLSAALGTGQKLSIFRDGQLIGDVSPTTTNWSFTDPGATDGKHDYVVKVVDALGQSGTVSSTFSLTIDTVAPNQAVTVTAAGGDANGSTSTSTALRMASASAGTTISGTVGGALGADEVLVVFRDGVRLGTASVSNGSWTYSDGVTTGTFKYTAQVQDAAGNLGQMSSVLAVQLGLNDILGTTRNDVLVGTSGADRFSAVGSAKNLGKGTIDVLTGGSGADQFVLGDSRGRFYDDGSSRTSGADDFARITDFSLSQGDRLQLKGTAAEYLQGWINNLQGFSGTGIYHDTNGNGVLDNRDELIALVQNHGPIDQSAFIYI